MCYETLYNDIELAACDAAEDLGMDQDEIWADIAFSVCFGKWHESPETRANINMLWETHFGDSFENRLKREGMPV